MRALVKQGIKPAHKRQLDRIRRGQESAITFEAVAKEWVSLKDWTDVTKARRLDMLARMVFPKIGELSVKNVTPAHILDVLNSAAKKNGLTVVAEARRTMSGVFELAVSTLRADADPVYPVRRLYPQIRPSTSDHSVKTRLINFSVTSKITEGVMKPSQLSA